MRSFVLLLFVAALTACASNRAQEFQQVAEGRSSTPEGEYKIGVDDRIQVSVWRNPELSVPLIGDVLAGGRAPAQVAETIRQKLSAYIRDPSVAVILVDLRSHEFLTRVRVTGAVR